MSCEGVFDLLNDCREAKSLIEPYLHRNEIREFNSDINPKLKGIVAELNSLIDLVVINLGRYKEASKR